MWVGHIQSKGLKANRLKFPEEEGILSLDCLQIKLQHQTSLGLSLPAYPADFELPSFMKNWCFQIVVLEETLENPLDCKENKSVNPKGN